MRPDERIRLESRRARRRPDGRPHRPGRDHRRLLENVELVVLSRSARSGHPIGAPRPEKKKSPGRRGGGASGHRLLMVEFLTPIGWLVALAAVLPVGAGIARARRDVQIRSRIGLAPPGRAAQVVSTAAAVFAVALLAAATARPAVRTSGTRGLRTDAQVFFVLDFPTGKRRIFAAVLPVAFILRRRDP